MGYLFAASIFDLVHFGLITVVVQWVLLWLGLRYMQTFQPLFGKAKPWLIAYMVLCLLPAVNYTGPDIQDIPRFLLYSVSIIGLVRTLLWLYFWYLIYRAITALEPIYGDLHSRMLWKLFYIDLGLHAASYAVMLLLMVFTPVFPPAFVPALLVLISVAQFIVTIIRLVYLYRAWQDFNTRAEQLRGFSQDTFSEDK